MCTVSTNLNTTADEYSALHVAHFRFVPTQCQKLPEGLSHRAHTEHNMQVVPDTLYQVAEH